MNRHERRAEEARTRNSFKDYDALYRRAFKKVDDRDIGEGFMRGAAAEADNINSMILHPPGVAPPPRDQCDVTVSAAYGPQRFVAHAKSENLELLKQDWTNFVEATRKLADNPLTGDPRSDARQFIFEMIVENRPYAAINVAVVTAGAIVWLATTSPAGPAIGHSHKRIHYEITETGFAADGRRGRNFRLMLA